MRLAKKICLYFTLFMTAAVCAQDLNSLSIAVYGNYSMPAGGLKDWFKPAANFALSAGLPTDSDWMYEGLIEYSKYDQENLSGYPKRVLKLSLEHIGFLFKATYSFSRAGMIRPQLYVAVGPHYWKGIRGEIAADSSLNIPYIKARVLEEWNWAFKTGIGLEIALLPYASLEVAFSYRFIVGDLWPTLQQHIELEGVSGFQTLNISSGIRIYL